MRFTISLAQMQVVFGKPRENLKKAVQFIETTAAHGSHAILLPELWSSGYDLENAASLARHTPEIIAELHRLASHHTLRIGGSLLDHQPDGIYNTFVWVDPALSQPLYYRKIHLFRLMAEHQWLMPGNQPAIIPTPWGLSGLAICYDLRFPELFRGYALEGARTFLLPAEWPDRRIEHWKILLRARAIENQCFMFAVNCIGASPKDQFGGCSAAVSPWGETIAEGSASDEMLLHAELDTELVDQARQFMPVFQDRRPDVYGEG
ncbi:MAG TPA: carbon-nitrogen family hydrolase [Anaerolinea sp.]|nr:carbon-nitrogen family hydrolase [Anaerolinea sp.]